MPLNDITSKILADAEREVRNIEEASQRELDKILAQKRGEIQEAVEAAKKSGQEEIAKTEERAEFLARNLKKNASLSVKQELLNEVFDGVKKALGGLSDNEYIEFVAGLFKNMPEIENGELVPAAYKAGLIEKAMKEAGLKFRVSKEVLPKGQDGFVVRNKEVEINNTFDNYVASIRPEHEQEAARILFS